MECRLPLCKKKLVYVIYDFITSRISKVVYRGFKYSNINFNVPSFGVANVFMYLFYSSFVMMKPLYVLISKKF